ncbi:sensor histidine kinase [Ferdinandcohnia quinoae]|uniref:histidine kinase n=1 Tax=Fredinandcohnia quinoae TaxID=2918902 RepID=A0AAW5E3U1_9BACI|nr:HAMP domain-containing sensor histidine kinase [Fredinandcohnia sp. SECRCQ15]MCH1627028.1 HAMP domain-containing histidine kinase [Fredinandcohnia sp. SECRCQ15]
MRLRTKINLSTAVMFILLLILINSASYFTFSRMMLSSELDRTSDEALKTLKGITQTESTVPAKNLLIAYAPVNGMLKIVRPDSSVDQAVSAPELSDLKDFPTMYHKKEKLEIVDYQGIPHAFVSIPMIWEGGEVVELQVIEKLASVEKNLKTLQIVLIIVTLLATIPVLISTRFLSNFITQPITSMIKTMRKIRENGQYQQIELPKKSKDELYQMGETFNEMMDLLGKNFEKQEQFVSNASHELKTPLTVIESYANLLKRRGLDNPELFHESVEAIHSEAIRMSELTQQLLLLAKHDERWKIEKKQINLTKLIEEAVRSFKEAYKREIEIKGDQNIIVKADPQKVKQLFYILMQNAHKYSEDPITVRIRSQQRTAFIEVIDKGIGIPKDDLAKVFDRFYRVDVARTRKTGGFGLGLSLAKEIADAMGAGLKLESTEGQGTTAQITLDVVSFSVNSHNRLV